jgi:hypothetical protein
MPRLDGSITTARGLRVRLRLPHRFDGARLRELLERCGAEADDLTVARLLRFDPRQGTTVVATALVDRCEEIVGLGTIERFADEPDLVVAALPEVRSLLADALRAHVARPRRSA